MSLNVHTIPILGDHKNYAYILQTNDGVNAVIDPGEADPIIQFCEDKNIHIDFILLTHHHWDHINGSPKLAETFGCQIAGPEAEDNKIKHLNIKIKDTHTLKLGTQTTQIIAVPGHTNGHIAYYFPETQMLFSGDVIFGGGCGKVLEGAHADMWASLSRIMALPDTTQIYFGHEYTTSNLEFGLTIEPDNDDLRKRLEKTRTQNAPSTPSTLALEKQTNVFLRAGSLERFTEIRTQKDNA